MSYNVKTLGIFERQAKKLKKKHPSLKQDLLSLVQSLKQNPELGTSLGKIVLKYVFPFPQKEKVKAVVQELLQMLWLHKLLFICFLFMTNLKKKQFPIKNSQSC